MLGTSHTTDAVSTAIVGAGLVVSRKSNVVVPSTLPPLMSNAQRHKVVDKFDRHLEDELVELLYKIDPTLKSLPLVWSGELELDRFLEETSKRLAHVHS